MAAIFGEKPRDFEPVEGFLKGLWVSAHAGIFEELKYRWLVFLIAMPVMAFLSTITFGFVRWLHADVLGPVANFFTLGALEYQLLEHPEWVVGAAILSANSDFRKVHAYLGWFGCINSWFVGMVFFWLTFNYGIFAAIVVHFLYDVIIFAVISFGNAFRPRREDNPFHLIAESIVRGLGRGRNGFL